MRALFALALVVAAPEGEQTVAVLAHPVARGDRIEVSDFVLEERGIAEARGALTPSAAGGMEATRNLSAGSVVRQSDLIRPRLVRRGQPVTIRIVSGTMVISAAGRALGDAGMGEPVRVVTDATSKTLDGVVDGAGTVRITTP